MRRALCAAGSAAALALLPVVAVPASAAAAAAPTIVTIQFDDGNADQYQALAPLSARGLRATFYVNTGPLGDAAHLSWAQLGDLAAAGNEITGHTVDHVNIKKLKPAEGAHQVCDDRAALVAHGYPALSFAYPFGSFDAGSEQVVASCGYTSGRGVSGVDGRRTFAETTPPADPFATRTPPNVKSGTTLATVQSYVTGAEQHGGGWVQIVIHHLCDHCDAYSMTLADFTAFLDWLAPRAATGTTVRTTAEVMSGA